MPNKPRRHRRPVPAPTASRPTTGTNIGGLPEDRRRAIFAALAEAKAAETGPDAARYAVARRFVVTIVTVEAIEREALAKDWPAA